MKLTVALHESTKDFLWMALNGNGVSTQFHTSTNLLVSKFDFFDIFLVNIKTSFLILEYFI